MSAREMDARSIFALGLTTALLFFAYPGVLFAQTGSVNIRPAKIEWSGEPGAMHKRDIEITNGTPFTLSVHVSFEDIAPTEQESGRDEAIRLLGETEGAHSLRGLLSVSQDVFTVPSGTSRSVAITLNIPRDVAAGGRYGSVVFAFRPVTTGANAGTENVAVESRVASLVFVRIEGGAKEEGSLAAFGVFNNERFVPSPTPLLPLRFQVAFQNTGAVHLNPYGRMTLSSVWGDTQNIIDPWAVLPLATRMREIEIRDSLSPGYYTATLELNRGYGDIVEERAVTFVVLPSAWQSIIGLFVLALFTLTIRKSLKLSRHFIS